MNALSLLQRAAEAGLQLHLDHGEVVRLVAPLAPSPALLAELRLHRDAIVRELSVVSRVDHDVAEAEAMAAFYAAPAGSTLPSPDPLTEGLLVGFRQHCATVAQTPSPGPRPPSRPGHPSHGS